MLTPTRYIAMTTEEPFSYPPALDLPKIGFELSV